MINLFLPFLFLSIISLLISVNFKINLNKSYLISILSIPILILFIGNFVSLYWAIYVILIIGLIFLIINKNYKKIFLVSFFGELFIFFIIYFLVIIYTTNLFLHKFDEFSEYGIVSKLIFFEEELMNNIFNIFAKGSPHKINIMGYLNYFFLKTSFLEFREQILYIGQNTLNIIIIKNLIGFISGNIKKIIFFLILFFLSFVLSTGFDKIYLDTTAALLISLIITTQLQDKNNSKYFIIFLSMIFLFCLKTSATIIFLGISSMFIFYYLFEKNYKIISFYLLLILSTYIIEKFYSYDFYLSKKQTNINTEKAYLHNLSYSLTYKKKIDNIKNFNSNNFFSQTNYLYLKKNFSDLAEKGIYHSSTFLVFNKIFQKLNINFKLIEIPLILFFWIFLLILLIKIINIENKFKLILFINIYILFIFFYWLIILYWSLHSNLVNEDFTIETSWQRHLGAIILGVLLYLIIVLFQKNMIGPKHILIILIFLSVISKPNSIRNFFPKEFIMKDAFWLQRYEQRVEIKKLSNFINNNVEKYSVLFVDTNNKDAYFLPILNYELIDKNLINIDLKSWEKFYNDFFIKHPLINNLENLYILFNKSNNENILNLIKSTDYKIIHRRNFDHQYSIYKISLT